MSETPNWFWNSLAILAVICVVDSAFAQNGSIVQDSRRKQNLQRSVDRWAEAQARPVLEGMLNSMDSLGVRIIEAQTVLPPELGGPRPGSIIRLPVEISATGYGYDSFGYRHDSFGHRGRSLRMECRIHQTLMARVDQSGRAYELVQNQRVTTPVACASRY